MSIPTPHLVHLARYHAWAYTRLLAKMSQIPDDKYRSNAGIVFRSIHGTLNHLLLVDMAWYAHFMGKYDDDNRMGPFWMHADKYSSLESKSSPWEEFITDREELANALREHSAKWITYLTSQPLPATLSYRHYIGGPEYTDNTSSLLLHLFNHGTHHRGQITAAVTALGFPPTDDLDYLNFMREEGAVEI